VFTDGMCDCVKLVFIW